ncbi:ComEA family DNA-binding protein [Acinetobacter indicus]|uniref:ComEA family DNA-binding protein n=1 Tax=Acinetobacter indicus TaxID=756892 RepID=A0AAW8YWS8_9GAMM|nr:ComEA family DNA-binding protein [Acinetobacter indicus]MCO8100450.1 ComEA family DNA-binding protein [Acinetobacter indicus]MCO8105920.1 ComEA family DNA-binding protein [Acinetobacter indicus]MCO8111617.1 ComEA family DNA-binding protein [Acinetobacter indicus]MDM1291925.1 ComEA family DNA-binding protein [Acinetobacter indicus]MDM1321922.1 ComEA family DNA-binding protein [Acinetobacter indicus]
MTRRIRFQHAQALIQLALMFCLFCSFFALQNAQAENYDARYLQWKAEQEVIDARLSSSASTKTSQPRSASAGSSEKINLNMATAAQLQQLSGVGQKKAEAIIEYRNRHGKFKRIEDLQLVKGIGPALLAKNRHRLGI